MATKKSPSRPRIDTTATDDRKVIGAIVIEQVGTTVRWLGVLACVAFVASCLQTIVVALAGRETNASIVLSLLANVDLSAILVWGSGAGGVAYGVAQNRLRKRTVSHLQERIQKYEQAVDPGRSSSHLSSTGDTNPQDA